MNVLTKPHIRTVRWHHDMIIDYMVAHPEATQNEIAAEFGFTATWLSIVVNSDAFKHRLQERKEEMIDPILRATVEDRLTTIANVAMEKMVARLQTNAPMTNRDLTELIKVSTNGLGLGPSKAPSVNVAQYVIPAPPMPATSEQWQRMAQPTVVVEEVQVRGDD